MKGNFLDSTISDARSERQSRGLLLIGAVAALLVTGLVLAGYSVLRKRHQQQTLAAQRAETKSIAPKGPVKAQVFVDDAMLKGDQTVLGGTVKNVSGENLSS